MQIKSAKLNFKGSGVSGLFKISKIVRFINKYLFKLYADTKIFK